jgi:alanyl-tRNA synthetase
LVDVVVDNFTDFFPEIAAKKEIIKKIIADEETSFRKTLERG